MSGGGPRVSQYDRVSVHLTDHTFQIILFEPAMLDLDVVYEPEAEEIEAHAIAFAQMMFAHSELERRVGDLQDVIVHQRGFGERPSNQWGARKRPGLMAKLISEHLGDSVPEAAAIKKLLRAAIAPCDQRNLLAHGHWWCFNRMTGQITVRSGALFKGDHPTQVEYTAAHIAAITENFKDLEVELYKLHHDIEERHPLDDDSLSQISDPEAPESS